MVANMTEIKTPSNTANVLMLAAGTRSFFIDVDHVACVIDLVEMQPAINEPNYIVGLIDYHGEVIPALDLALRLELEAKEYYNLDTPIVICTFNAKHYAIICDHVDRIIQVDKADFSLVDDEKASFFKNVIFIDDEMVFNIDLKILFSLERLR